MLLAGATAAATVVAVTGFNAGAAVAAPSQASSSVNAPTSAAIAPRSAKAPKKLTKAQKKAAKRQAAAKRAAAAALAAQAAAAAQLQENSRATAKVTTPAAPTGLASTAQTTNSISLKWNASSGANGYSVYNNGGYLTWTSATSVVLSGLTPATAYYLQVVATTTNNSIFSAKSAGLSVSTKSAVVAPSTPTGLASSAVSATGATVSWSAVTGATSYQLYRGATLVASPTTTSATDSGLTAATSYSYTVKAVNAGGSSAASAALAVTTLPNVPAAPTGLVSSGVYATGATVSWSAASGATSYQVFRGSTLIASPTATSVNDSGLAAATAYSYTVKAVNSGGTSGASAVLVVTTLPNAPAAPTGLASSGVTATDATITWAPSSGATGYSVLRDGVAVGTTSTATFSATGLTAGTTYSFTVAATNTGGTSAASSALAVTTLPNAPAAPTGLASSGVTASGVTVSWSAVSGAASYQVFRGSTLIASPTGTSVTDSGLTASTAYSYTVTAVNSGGTSAASSVLAVTTLPSVPAAPTGLASSGVTASGVTVSWSAVSGATSYQVFRGSTLIASPTGTSVTDSGLAASTAYSYTVKAVNTGGTSTASPALAVTTSAATPTTPDAPTGLAASGLTATTVTLTWNAVAGAASYDVYDNGSWINWSTTPSITLTGLVAGSTNSFQVLTKVSASVYSARSTALAVTMPSTVTVPAAPTGLASSSVSMTSATISWTAVSGATGYQVYRGSTLVGSPSAATYGDSGLTASTAYSYTVKATNSAGASPASAALAVTTAASAPTSTMPVGDLPGWHSVLAEDFNTNAPLGSFVNTYSNTVGAYPAGWKDTSKNGTYNPEKTLSVSNGVMDTWLHSEGGQFLVNAATPKLPTMLYGRFAMRMKADQVPGYKIAPLLWPDSDSWNDGEIDFPEGDLNGSNFSAFTHHAGAPQTQDWLSAGVNGDNWHTYEIAWSPGQVQYFVDGALKGTHTVAIPTKPMHWVLQFETQIGGGAPSASASGHVSIDWIKAYSYAP